MDSNSDNLTFPHYLPYVKIESPQAFNHNTTQQKSSHDVSITEIAAPMAADTLTPSISDMNLLTTPVSSSTAPPDVIARLSFLSRSFYMAIDQRVMDTVEAMTRTHLVTNFESRIDNYVAATNIEDYLRNLRHMTDGAPDMRLQCTRHSAHVDPTRGRAIVYVSFVIRGRPTEVRRVSMTVGEWTRRKEQWVCLRCTMLRGLHLGIMDDLDNHRV